jgi:hypothetical protein
MFGMKTVVQRVRRREIKCDLYTHAGWNML